MIDRLLLSSISEEHEHIYCGTIKGKTIHIHIISMLCFIKMLRISISASWNLEKKKQQSNN